MMRAHEYDELDSENKQRWMKFGSWDRTYFPRLVGIEMIEVRRDYCAMKLPYREDLDQPMGIVHGGAIATLIDVVVVPAIGSAYPPSTGFSTVDLHIQYLSALRAEDAIAQGWVVKRGRRIVFCQAEVRSGETQRLIATGSLTYSAEESSTTAGA